VLSQAVFEGELVKLARLEWLGAARSKDLVSALARDVLRGKVIPATLFTNGTYVTPVAERTRGVHKCFTRVRCV